VAQKVTLTELSINRVTSYIYIIYICIYVIQSTCYHLSRRIKVKKIKPANKISFISSNIIIIIITNEKIKVMLSRKRCRGTLPDYKKGEISKCQSKL